MKKTIGFLLSCFLVLSLSGHADAWTVEKPPTTDPLKPWTITLSSSADKSSVGNKTVFIKADNNMVHPSTVSISTDGEKIEVKPSQSYTPGVHYTLHVTQGVKSKKGIPLKEESLVSFTYEGLGFKSVSGVVNPLFTNLKTTVQSEVVRVELTDQTGAVRDMHRASVNSFSLGLLGMAAGDKLQLKAFDRNGIVLEELTYELTN